MKLLINLVIVIAILLGTAITFDACKKDKNEDPNFEYTGDTIIDPRDGQTYYIVDIGTQTWFAENLNYETGNSWCYEDDDNNCDVYGRLYVWETIMSGEASSDEVPSGVQGICPPGWHLPSDEEWKVLEMHLGMSQNEVDIIGFRGTQGMQMKSTFGWYNDGNGTDAVGFTALPSGFRYADGFFSWLGEDVCWWSATEKISAFVWHRGLRYNCDKVIRATPDKRGGMSVRCIKD